MSAQNSAGVQTLLEAEREAQKIVQDARDYRTKRVKEARDEAFKEIKEYTRQKEQELATLEREVGSASIQENSIQEERAKKETEDEVRQMKEKISNKAPAVVNFLLNSVVQISQNQRK